MHIDRDFGDLEMVSWFLFLFCYDRPGRPLCFSGFLSPSCDEVLGFHENLSASFYCLFCEFWVSGVFSSFFEGKKQTRI